jgi:hypothetical protein
MHARGAGAEFNLSFLAAAPRPRPRPTPTRQPWTRFVYTSSSTNIRRPRSRASTTTANANTTRDQSPVRTSRTSRTSKMATIHSVSFGSPDRIVHLSLPVLHRPAFGLWPSRYASTLCFHPPHAKLTHDRALGIPRDIGLWMSNVSRRLKPQTRPPRLAQSDFSATAIRESSPIPKIMAKRTTVKWARRRCIPERDVERATGPSQIQALPIPHLPEPLSEVEMPPIRPPPANLVAHPNSLREA